MATDESDEGPRLEIKANSIFGPSFLLSILNAEEHKLSLILLLPHKIPIILSSFNKVLERWSQVKSALFPKPRRPQNPVSSSARSFLFYLFLFMTARNECQRNPLRVGLPGTKVSVRKVFPISTSHGRGEKRNAPLAMFLMVLLWGSSPRLYWGHSPQPQPQRPCLSLTRA